MINQQLIEATKHGDIEINITNILGKFSKNDIYDTFADDPWLKNIALNVWERSNGITKLESYPLDISIPMIDVCNIKCVFCSYWRGVKPRYMTVEELRENYTEAFKYTKLAGINPSGEPFLHPDVANILRTMNDMTDPRCYIYVVTNGTLLEDKYDLILDTVNSLNFSINAGTAETYAQVMGTKPEMFDTVINNIKNLNAIKHNKKRGKLHLYATYVVLKHNIGEIPEFLRIAEELGFTKIWFRTLATPNDTNIVKPRLNPEYHTLPPFLHPDFEKLREQAITALKATKLNVYAEPELWDNSKDFSQEKHLISDKAEYHKIDDFRIIDTDGKKIEGEDNPFWSEADPAIFPHPCIYPFRNLVDPCLSNIQPVCNYQEQLPGFEAISYNLKNKTFMDIWNSEAHQALRKALFHGSKLPNICQRCNFLTDLKGRK